MALSYVSNIKYWIVIFYALFIKIYCDFAPLFLELGLFHDEEIGVKELYEMFKLVTETLGQPPVVVDYDDLIENPGKTNLCFLHFQFD